MTRRKIAVAVILALTVAGAFAAYAFRPTATSTNVAVNEPNTGTGTGTGTTPSTPSAPPAKLSDGPKHAMCVHENDHIPEHAWARGANWYRFYDRTACPAVETLVSLLAF